MNGLHKSFQQRARERAYELWEEAGRPDGRDQEFWAQAVTELEAQREQDEPTVEARDGRRSK